MVMMFRTNTRFLQGFFHLLALACGCIFIVSFEGQCQSITATEQAQAEHIESFSFPSAGEFFVALAKVGRPNWGTVARTPLPTGIAERPQIALSLGVLIADGYITVENQNSQEMKNIGRELLEMARKLNAGDNVIGRCSSLNDFAENNDWNSLHEELDATRNEIKISLVEQKDVDLVFLVSLGTWLRCIEASSALIAVNYDAQIASLFSQSQVAQKFLDRIYALPERLRNQGLIRVMQEQTFALEKIMKPLANNEISQEQVVKISELSAEAIAAIAGIKGQLPSASLPDQENSSSTNASTKP